MFNFLLSTTTEQAIASIYYAIRILKHIQQIRNLREGFRIDGLDTEPSSEDAMFAGQILSEIEQIEQTTINEISKQKAEEYVQALATILQDMVKRKLNYDEERGQELLEELRRT